MAHPWLTLCTKQNMERYVTEFLDSQGVETYLPQAEQYIVRRRCKEMVPFFPGYLFAWAEPTSPKYLALNWAPGVKGIVKFGGRPAVVPDEIVAEIRQRLDNLTASGYFDRRCPYQPGDVVRIKAGPFKGLDAIFDRELSRHGRVKVLLELLGRLTGCEVDLDWIEKVG
jgi:transcriptional antiterminator RfaH